MDNNNDIIRNRAREVVERYQEVLDNKGIKWQASELSVLENILVEEFSKQPQESNSQCGNGGGLHLSSMLDYKLLRSIARDLCGRTSRVPSAGNVDMAMVHYAHSLRPKDLNMERCALRIFIGAHPYEGNFRELKVHLPPRIGIRSYEMIKDYLMRREIIDEEGNVNDALNGQLTKMGIINGEDILE